MYRISSKEEIEQDQQKRETPRSYQVIVLLDLDIFSKILENTVQSRLSATTHLKGPVSVHQAGSLLRVSAEDAAACPMYEIDVTQRSGLCATNYI